VIQSLTAVTVQEHSLVTLTEPLPPDGPRVVQLGEMEVSQNLTCTVT